MSSGCYRGFKSSLRLGSALHYRAFLPGNSTPEVLLEYWAPCGTWPPSRACKKMIEIMTFLLCHLPKRRERPGHLVSVSPASVDCNISISHLHDRLPLTRQSALGSSVASVKEEDHAHGEQVLCFDTWNESSLLEKRRARHISPVFEAG